MLALPEALDRRWLRASGMRNNGAVQDDVDLCLWCVPFCVCLGFRTWFKVYHSAGSRPSLAESVRNAGRRSSPGRCAFFVSEWMVVVEGVRAVRGGARASGLCCVGFGVAGL